MMWVYAGVALVGLALGLWAEVALRRFERNPKRTMHYFIPRFPVPRPRTRNGVWLELCEDGPYRWLQHPMYIGNVLLIAGLGGVAAGFWNFLALGVLAELLVREWAWRELQQ